MKKHNILAPGGGGATAVNTIKSLRMAGFRGRIVSTDANPLSAGLYLADAGYVLPPASEPSFMEKALEVIEKEEIDLILPTSGFDIVPYSQHKDYLFGEYGVFVVVSSPQTLETCLNKMKFYERMLAGKFDLPYTTTNPEDVKEFPCFVKPIKGKGSRNTFKCDSKAELEIILRKHKDMIIQEYLPGKEYTVDTFSDLKGKGVFALPRERIEVKAGISFKGRIVLDKKIMSLCLKFADHLGIIGPSNIQLKADAQGDMKLTEINPRLGGGTILATYAGANFPELIVRMVDGEKIKTPKIREVTMVRYYSEIVLDNKNRKIKDAR